MNISYIPIGNGLQYTPASTELASGREVGLYLPLPSDPGIGAWSEGHNGHANERAVVKPPWEYDWLPLYPQVKNTKRAVAARAYMDNYAGGNIYAVPFATPANL